MMNRSIAIVAPSPVPFVVGGSEKLWWGLQEYINRNTVDHCELIKVCAPEASFADLVSSYDRFDRLELRHFDMVLSTKYPAWMIRHPNHRVYFQHPFRRVYEYYDGPGGIPESLRRHPKVKKIEEAAACAYPDVRRLIDACLDLAADPGAPPEAVARNGPVSRLAIHTLDRRGIGSARKVLAISRTVRDHRGYFKNPETIPVVYHPSNLQGLRDTGQDYFFTASRLVRAKRIGMIIDAHGRSGVDIPLVIAGRGPEMNRLRKLAKDNVLVRFTGFVSDKDLAGLYGGSLAVPFVPENEDMGLVTLEAMRAGKPVITCTDSGGPAELVQCGRTGWVCPPDEKRLARVMRTAAANPLEAARMGAVAREQAVSRSWEQVVASVFGFERKAREYGRARNLAC